MPVFGTMTVDRTHITALANSFAREPDWKPTRRLTRVGWMLLLPAFLMFIVLAIGTVGEEPGRAQMSMAVSGVFMVGIYASPGLLTLAAARDRRRHNNRILRGRPHAHALWGPGSIAIAAGPRSGRTRPWREYRCDSRCRRSSPMACLEGRPL
ncbi:hypothetical protein [Nocardia abscessus]|uniref:hypothetical protein n=1 Tax=Nocardia abscessus TaxID=120957 RepID=UPI0002D4CD61|nr:hypothetical protein [Nocardia abscessus]MCC3330994.1 hypothetical protein [Nocardia abscessus]